MNKNPTRLFLAAAAISMTVGTVNADDTEIYLGNNLGADEVKPNIVFIIDTSGSMSSDVPQTPPAYKPAESYVGTCQSDRIYWSSTGTAPSCTTTQWFTVDNNKCNSVLSGMAASGWATAGRAAMWSVSNGKWLSLQRGVNGGLVECRNDRGVHGDGIDNTKLYAKNASSGGPWAAGSTNEYSWSRTSYTFYTGNYLNYLEGPGTVTKTRLEVVQEVFKSLIDSTSGINMAIMRFDDKSQEYNKGGYFLTPMMELNDSSRTYFKGIVDDLTPGGFTPLSETLYEATQYFRGETIKFGLTSSPGTDHLSTYSGTKYISPIAYQCQKNFVVLLTDGDPTYDYDADTAIRALPNFLTVTDTCSFNGGDDCLDELAQYLHRYDLRDDLNDNQTVITYTVGFATNQQLLQDAATKGGGKYFTADETTGLTDAFTSILTEILAVNTSFTAPAVSVNAFNRLTHLNELYFAVFRPSSQPKWDGNIKRYCIGGSPMIIRDARNSTLGCAGDPAIDPNTGFFSSNSLSWWYTDPVNTDNPDGDIVQFGGAAGKIPLPRKVATYLGNSHLNATTNTLTSDNVTATMLGLDSYSADPNVIAQQVEKVLSWARGVDIFDSDLDGDTLDARLQMGDPLHTEPVLITYGMSGGVPDLTLYATTNEGYLHAIDTSTGVEEFAFVPKELLGNLNTLVDDNASIPHPYGLDGPLTAYVQDAGQVGYIEGSDKVYLYATMRRGGSYIYALNVTDRNDPQVLWVKGSGSIPQLGQTWSKPVVAKVSGPLGPKTVLIMGGGYDPDQDNNSVAQDDDIGRAIYMLDPETGDVLWWAGPVGSGSNLELAAMTNSIPSEVAVFDINSDGLSDRMYVGDMRGQLWRFDINNSSADLASFVSGGVIAKLGDGTPEGNRRFYYPPSVSLSTTNEYLNIAIGSGYRAHPLNTVIQDKFFVFRDKNITTPAAGADGTPMYSTKFIDDLYNATSNILQTGDAAAIETASLALAGTSGFYIDLNRSDNSWEGEKCLAQAVTLNSQVIFTTFTPVASSSAACAPSQGTAKVYTISVEDGTATVDADRDGSLERSDRGSVLTRSGIPPRPTIIITEDGATIVIGTEQVGCPPGSPDCPEDDDDLLGNLGKPLKTQWQRK